MNSPSKQVKIEQQGPRTRYTYKFLVGVSGFPKRLFTAYGSGEVSNSLVYPASYAQHKSNPSIVSGEGLVIHSYSTEPLIVGGVLRTPRKQAHTVPPGAAIYIDSIERDGSPTGAYWLTVESSLPVIEE